MAGYISASSVIFSCACVCLTLSPGLAILQEPEFIQFPPGRVCSPSLLHGEIASVFARAP